jgi:hypothetical protein
MKKSSLFWQTVSITVLLFIAVLVLGAVLVPVARAATGNVLHNLGGPGSGVQPGQLWSGGKDQGHQQDPAWVKLKNAGLVRRNGNSVSISLNPQQTPPDLSAHVANVWSVILLAGAGIFLVLVVVWSVFWWMKHQRGRAAKLD